jgi:hypothetical protein
VLPCFQRLLESSDDLGMRACEVARFSDVVLQIEEFTAIVFEVPDEFEVAADDVVDPRVEVSFG